MHIESLQGGLSANRLFPLSMAQLDIWLAQALNPGSTCYNVGVYLEIAGSVDGARLEVAIAQELRHCDNLRLRFVSTDHGPRQYVAPFEGYTLTRLDLSHCADPQSAAMTWMRQDLQRTFDLGQDCLFRYALLKLADNRFFCYQASHHLVVDGFGSTLIQRRIADYYRDLGEGTAKRTPRQTSWPEFLADEADYVLSDQHERDRLYWRSALGSPPDPLTLSGRAPALPSGFVAERSSIPRSAVARLRENGLAHGASFAAAICAAVAIYLCRMTGSREIVLGVPVTGRTNAKLRRVSGLVAQIVPLRLDIDFAASTGELLQQAGRRMREALRHQRYGAGALRRELGLTPDQPDIYGAIVNFVPINQDTAFAGHPARRYPLQIHRVDDVCITIDAGHPAHDVLIEVSANQDNYEADEVAQHLRRLLLVLELVAGDPKRGIGRLPILSAAERRAVLDMGCAPATAREAASLTQLFDAQAARTPDATALVCGTTQLSFAALDAEANRLARQLAKRGVGPERIVAIALPRSAEMIAALFGVLKAGAAFMLIDPDCPPLRMTFMLQDSRADWLLTRRGIRTDLLRAHAAVPPTLLLDDADFRCQLDAEPGAPLADAGQTAPATPDALAYLIYTSGSTGAPKGVAGTQAGLVNRLAWQWETMPYGADDVACAKTSTLFIDSLTEILAPLLQGVKLVMANGEQARDPARLAALLAEQRVTRLTLVPSLLNALLDRPQSLAALRICVSSGEALPRALANRFSAVVPQAVLWNFYGVSEASGDSVAAPVAAGDGPVGIGRPISGTQIYILDPYLSPVPVGGVGELHIAGEGLAHGYHGQPGLTGERFVACPFGPPGARMYRTGDLARWRADGTIECLGRADHQVKIRGVRIEPGEIEAVLAAQVGVAQAAVVSRDGASGRPSLAAYLVPSGHAAPDLGRLRRALGDILPDAMIPASFAVLQALPLTESGKLDRGALPSPAEQAWRAGPYAPPEGPVETAIAAIWADLLHVERVGRHDQFFELGGDSLLAVRLAERLRQLGFQADAVSLFSQPTLAGLAASLAAADANSGPPPPGIAAGCEAITPDMLPLATLDQSGIDTAVAQVPGGARNVADIYRLAPLQEGLLFLSRMSGAGDAHVLSALLATDSRESADRFLSALQCVIDRHDILRTAILWDGLPEPVQVVWRTARLPVEELTPEDIDPAAALWGCRALHQTLIDVRRAPLMQAMIVSDAARNRWLLLLQMHHLVVDQTSLDLILDEVRAHLSGRPCQLPAPPPFRNFVAEAWRQASREDDRAFFSRMLGDVDEVTAPFGVLDRGGDGPAAASYRVALETRLATRLRLQARQLGVSAACLFHLAWAVVLARTSGRDEAVFGTVLLGRMTRGAGADRALGLFINTLPLRLPVDRRSVEAAVRLTRDRLAELAAREHASLALAQGCSALPNGQPVFAALLNYRFRADDFGGDHPPQATGRSVLPGVDLLHAEQGSPYPFTLAVDDLGTGFTLTAQAPARVGPDDVCLFMQTALENLVDALSNAPDTAMHRLSILPHAKRHQILRDWNETATDLPNSQCLHELVEAQAGKTPDAVALVAGAVSLSYGALNARANQLAHYLMACGVTPETRVAVACERSAEMVIAVLATLKAGGAYVPLDPTYPAARLAFMIDDSAARILLTQQSVLASLGRLPGTLTVLTLDADPLIAPWSALPDSNPPRTATRLVACNLAYVIYTSGSTGTPKGVMVEHRNCVASTLARLQHYGACERFLLTSSLAFDSAVAGIFGTLAAGGTLFLAAATGPLDPAGLAAIIGRGGITDLLCVPSLLDALMEQAVPGQLSSLRRVILAGETLLPATLSRAAAQLGHADFYNEYGPTEATVWATVQRCRSGQYGGSVPIGRPIANATVYILDHHRAPVPAGVTGEIYIGGAGVARGYVNLPALTADRFVADDFAVDAGEPAARMYRTGDLARFLPDGTIEFIGRNDRQVKLRGYRIELDEIEVIVSAQAGISQAAVVACNGEAGGLILVAYLVPDAGAVPDHAQLRRNLAERLPDHMVPAVFVDLASLPLGANGKLDRRALPPPGSLPARAASDHPDLPPTPTEQALARLWRDVLQVTAVGPRDDFFATGGHSLKAMRIAGMIRDVFNVELSLARVFEARTLQAQAAAIDRALLEGRHAPRSPPICRNSGAGRFPLSYAQVRMWLIQSLEPQSSAYNIVSALRIEGQLDAQALSQAFEAVCRRHEPLRCTVCLVDGVPMQDSEAWTGPALAVVDLQSRSDAELEARRLAEEEARKPFDLARGPLIRTTLFRLEPARHLLVIVLHHIAGDHWSMGVLGREVATLYYACRHGRQTRLEPPAISYRDYVLWQRDPGISAELDRQLRFWKQNLRDLPILALPTDRQPSQPPGSAGAFRHVPMPEHLVPALEHLSRRAGSTLFMTMLAAFAVLLHRMTGQTDIPIGVPVANRTRAATENLIGTFVNTLVLRIDLSGNPRFLETLTKVRAVALDAFANQDVPYDWLVQQIGQRRDAGRPPLTQVLFNLLNTPMHGIEFDGLDWEAVLLDRGGAQSELGLTVNTQIIPGLLVEYNSELFEPETIDRLIGQYIRILDRVTAAPQTTLRALPLLPPEQGALLREWNGETLPDCEPAANTMVFPRLFAQQAALTPAAPAISWNGATMSYADLHDQANAVARTLRARGVGPGVLVGVCVDRTPALLTALLAVQLSGGAYVPLDPHFPPARLSYMLSDSGAKLLLVAGQVPGGLDLPDAVGVLDLATLEPAAVDRTAHPDALPSPSDTAYVIYTSGSTGRPKGVTIRHGALANLLRAMQQTPGLTAGDVLAAVTTMSFDIAALEFYLPLMVGARIELVPREAATDGAALARTLASSGTSVLQATPTTWRMLIEAGWTGRAGFRALCGGEKLPRDLADAILDRTDELWNLYGPTETTIWSTVERVERGSAEVSIGRPICNTQVHILDPAGNQAEIGVIGEICIGGAGVAAGYHGQPALTAKHFIPDPFASRENAILYRTGDLGRWSADGKLYHLGRQDAQVKLRGFRIELEEIEIMLRSHPAVRHAVAAVVEAPGADQRLVGYVVYRDEMAPTVSELRSHLRRFLPDYMIPSMIVPLQALPLTPNGKTDRQALPDPFRSTLQKTPATTPSPGLEQAIAAIWRAVLQIEAVTPDDYFFDLGGNSLLSLRVVQMLEKQTGCRLDPRALFFHPLRQVAALVKPERSPTVPDGG